MKYLGMLDGDIEEQSEVLVIPHILGPQLRVTAKKGGIVRPTATVGDWVTKDTGRCSCKEALGRYC